MGFPLKKIVTKTTSKSTITVFQSQAREEYINHARTEGGGIILV